MFKVALISFLSLFLMACGPKKVENLSNTVPLGKWNSFNVSFVIDEDNRDGSGFYRFDHNLDKDAVISAEFEKPKYVGKINNFNVYFISETSRKTKAKGFYVKEVAGNLVPIGGIQVEDDTSHTSIDTVVLDTKNVDVSTLSKNELISLGQEILELAKQR